MKTFNKLSPALKNIFIWSVSFIFVIIILLIVLPLTVSNQTTAQVFFGLTAASGAGVLVTWIMSKSFNSKVRRRIKLNVSTRIVLKYLPHLSHDKITEKQVILTLRLRRLYAYIFFACFLIATLIIALIFAYAL